MLGYDNLGHAVKVAAFLVLIDVIVFGTMDEEHHVGILLYGSRLAEVAELRTLAFKALAGLYSTVELTEGEDGDVELLCQTL